MERPAPARRIRAACLTAAAMAALAAAGRGEEEPDAPPPPVAVVMDTIRVVAAPLPDEEAPPAPAPDDGLRDPRTEPLFVRYAAPAQILFLADRLDLDKVRWRYGPPDSADRAAR